MKHFRIVVDNDPERFTFSVPSIAPIELGSDCQLNFEDSACDGLHRDFGLHVGYVAHKLVHLVLVVAGNVSASFIKLLLVEVVHADFKLLQAVDYIVFNVAESRYLGVSIR